MGSYILFEAVDPCFMFEVRTSQISKTLKFIKNQIIDIIMQKKSKRRRIASRLGKVVLSIAAVSLMTSPMAAAAETSKVVTSGTKKVTIVRKVFYGTYSTFMLARSISGSVTAVTPADYFCTSLDYIITGASFFHFIKR